MKKFPKTTPYHHYIDYIPGLDKESKTWYNWFNSAYYHRSTKAMDIINMPVDTRRMLYNRHRSVCEDCMNQKELDYIEDLTKEI